MEAGQWIGILTRLPVIIYGGRLKKIGVVFFLLGQNHVMCESFENVGW